MPTINPINKIGFIVYHPFLWSHYESIWESLPKESFEVLLHDTYFNFEQEPSGRDFLLLLKNHGYSWTPISSALASKTRFPVVVANHKIEGRSISPIGAKASVTSWFFFFLRIAKFCGMKLFGKRKLITPSLRDERILPNRLGDTTVRMMYGADVSKGWSLGWWNNGFDWIMCHGPHDEKIFQALFDVNTMQMGYPRFDKYFAKPRAAVGEIPRPPSKIRILYLPSWSDIHDKHSSSSMPLFERLAREEQLQQKFEVTCRPHPISLIQEASDILALEILGIAIDRNPLSDASQLFQNADFVFVDYGESAFSALYTRKKIVFLTDPSFERAKILRGASNESLMNLFPTVSCDSSTPSVTQILGDENLWGEITQEAEVLRDLFFAPYNENSGETAARFLHGLLLGEAP